MNFHISFALMRYPWISLTILLMWGMTTYTALVAPSVDINSLVYIALAATLVIGYFGFKVPR